MDVRVVEKFDEFLSLRKKWSDLLGESDNNVIFLTHEWFCCWWLAFGKDKKLSILLFETIDKVVGIVPLLLTDDKHRRLKVRKFSFLENGISPRINFIASLAHKETVVKKCIEYLSENNALWHMAVLRKIVTDSENYKVLRDELSKRSIPFLTQKALQTPFILIDSSWEDYYAARSVKFRKVMRNKINRVKRQGSFNIEKISEKKELEKVLPVLFKISAKSWKSKENLPLSYKEKETAFYKNFTEVGGENGWIDVWLLKINGKPAAFEYHLRYEKKIYSIRADYDEEYRDLSPGSFLEYNIMKSLFENSQIKEFDFCGESYQYTLNWTNTIKSHTTFVIFNNSILFSRVLGFTEGKIVPPLRKLRKVCRESK